MDEIVIRMAKPEETGILAEIERICFPPQEAASPKQVEERMRTFPENFVVAEADGSPVGFINGGTTDKPYLPDEMYHDVNLHISHGVALISCHLQVSMVVQFYPNSQHHLLIRWPFHLRM